jgi:2,4-didehydro-3-deoxy-L-rhamnonate hydrolase
MKLIRFDQPGKENPGVLLEDGTRLDVYGFVSDYDEHFSEMMESRGSRLGSRANPLLRPRFPLPSGLARRWPGKIICIGLNFRDHARESKMEIPKEPVIFFKSTSSVVGPNDDVVIPKGGQKVHREVELRS